MFRTYSTDMGTGASVEFCQLPEPPPPPPPSCAPRCQSVPPNIGFRCENVFGAGGRASGGVAGGGGREGAGIGGSGCGSGDITAPGSCYHSRVAVVPRAAPTADRPTRWYRASWAGPGWALRPQHYVPCCMNRNIYVRFAAHSHPTISP